MNIALIGYGKMGHMVEEAAVVKGHTIVLTIDESNRHQATPEHLKKADVAIEFTAPESAFENVMLCLRAGVPVVSGSTGWNHQLAEAKTFCLQQGGSFIHASNFSIGVNLFFQLNSYLARLMNGYSGYEVLLKEIHHTQKKDAPSGTAVTLAEGVLQHLQRKQSWVAGPAAGPAQIAIESERTDPAPGTHFVKYTSPIDDIEIVHTAHNRQGFAQGAVVAAEYIAGRKGVFTMTDVLGF